MRKSILLGSQRWIAGLLLVAACGALLAGPKLSAAQDNTITVGVVLPVTGKEAKPGQYQKEGIELAIKQINDKGGIPVGGKKYQIKEVFYDDGSDGTKSASLVERAMTSDSATVVLGGYSTGLGEPESVMGDRHQTPWITTGAGATSIFSHGYQYAFGTLSPVELIGSTSMEFLGSLVDQGKLKKGLKIAIAVENTDHGKDYVNGVQKWMDKHPGYFTIVFNERFEEHGTDYSPILQKVKAANADIFLSDAHLPDYITMERQYLQSGMHHQMVSYGARGPELNARQALGDGINYLFAGIWWSDKLPYPQVKQFAADYKQFTGHDPDSWYAATAYDGVRILAQAITAAGAVDKNKIRDALRKAVLKDSILPGATLKFEPNGQAAYPFLIVQNKPGGKYDIVYPKNGATGDAVAPIP